MAMGKRKSQRQAAIFVATDDLARSPGHPFYQKLNRLLATAEFDTWVERRCQQYYETAEKRGKPSIPPGVYFRMLLIGFFEGIDSQRGIAWRIQRFKLRDKSLAPECGMPEAPHRDADPARVIAD